MDWQQLVALSIVAVTAGAFVWSRLRRGRRAVGCGAGCGCAGGHGPPPRETIIYRARKGEPGEIVVRPR